MGVTHAGRTKRLNRPVMNAHIPLTFRTGRGSQSIPAEVRSTSTLGRSFGGRDASMKCTKCYRGTKLAAHALAMAKEESCIPVASEFSSCKMRISRIR